MNESDRAALLQTLGMLLAPIPLVVMGCGMTIMLIGPVVGNTPVWYLPVLVTPFLAAIYLFRRVVTGRLDAWACGLLVIPLGYAPLLVWLETQIDYSLL